MIDKHVEADPLSGILERLRTVPWSAGVASFNQHWTVSTPAGQVSFYVAARGDFFLSFGGNQPATRISQGTYVLLPHGVPHVLFSRLGSGAQVWSDREFRLSGDGSGSCGTVIYGHFPAASLGNNCFDAVFPQLVQLDGASTPLLARCAPMVDLLIAESRDAELGWQAVITEVVRTQFTQLIRALTLNMQLEQESTERGNWIRAALDASIGPVLAMLHDSPEKPWTVAMLARQAHMAKSAFSERFRAAVGQPPLKYLTEYRVKIACQLLRETDFGVKEIAKNVGYESASSFSNAFKRWVGLSPADYRRAGVRLTSPPADQVRARHSANSTPAAHQHGGNGHEQPMAWGDLRP